MNAVFKDRKEAGRKLAKQLTSYVNHPQAIVLGLPRGGVPVAYEIAKNLNLPLDVCMVRKLGLPNYPETAMGAIAEDALVHDYSGKITVINADIVQASGIDQAQIQAIAAKERAELRWRSFFYRNYRPIVKIRDQTIILVDDGIATGSTIYAAIIALQKHKPKQIVIAVPVTSSQGAERLNLYVDNFIYVVKTESFSSVGFWYEDFSQVTDQEVRDLLCKKTYGSLAKFC